MKNESAKKKLKGYIPYAMGEVFLVVIGILIAVQVNNWNTKRNNIVLAQEHLTKISNELKRDTAVFSQVIEMIDQIIEVKTLVLQDSRMDTLPIEYLDAALNTQYLNIRINDAAFSSMTDQSILNLHEFDTIFQKINNYYTYNQDYLNNFNDWERNLATRESAFWEEQDAFELTILSDSTNNIPILQDPKERKDKMVKMIQSVKGRNFLRLSLFRYKSLKGIYTQTKTSAGQLLKEINLAD